MAAYRPLVLASGETQQLQEGDALAVSSTVTTAAAELVVEQTGDGYGPTRIRLRNRDGTNGAVFENDSLDLVDFAFRGSSLASQSVRFERRPGLTLAGNEAGEFQIGPAGAGATTLVVGPGASSFRRGALGVGATTPLGRLDVHGGSIVVSQDSSTGDSRAAGYVEGALAAAADASWKGRVTISAGDSTSNNAGKRTGITVESDGTQAVTTLSGTVTAPTPAPGDNSTKVATTAYVQTNAGPAVILTGAYSALPAAGAAGRLYLPTDGHAMGRDNGATWDWWRGGTPVQPPPTSGWSWVNQPAGATATASGTGLYVRAPKAGGEQPAIYTRPVIAPSGYTVTLGFEPFSVTGSFPFQGLYLSDGTKAITFTLHLALGSPPGASIGIQIAKYTGTTFSSGAVAYLTTVNLYTTGRSIYWFRVRDDGTNRIYQMSADGTDWETLLSTLRTDYITPTRYGVDVTPDQGNTYAAAMMIHSWSETTS